MLHCTMKRRPDLNLGVLGISRQDGFSKGSQEVEPTEIAVWWESVPGRKGMDRATAKTTGRFQGPDDFMKIPWVT